MRFSDKAKALSELFPLNVAKSDGQRVGGVGRLGEDVHIQQCANHELHLPLVGMTIPGHAGFHFAGRIGADLNAVLLRSKEYNAADLGKAKGGTNIQSSENGFHGHGSGMEFLNQPGEEGVNIVEAGNGRRFLAFRWDAKCSKAEDAQATAVGFDDAIAGGARSRGVNAKDTPHTG